MDDNALHIRTAHLSDAPALRAIYAPYVEKTAITFECTVPDVEEFAARMRATLRRYPYLVASAAASSSAMPTPGRSAAVLPMPGRWR